MLKKGSKSVNSRLDCTIHNEMVSLIHTLQFMVKYKKRSIYVLCMIQCELNI